MKVSSLLKGVWADKFKRYLILTLIILGIILFFNYTSGFIADSQSGAARAALAADAGSAQMSVVPAPTEPPSTLTLPFLGEIDVMSYSLPALAIILGLIDGFNPCAMWVLAYLISLILSVNDKRKIWLLVGSFVAASGILYFLFMTAWLNVFLFIGFLRPVTILVGLIAIGFGANDVREFIRSRGAPTCPIGDVAAKGKTMSKMKRLVLSPLTLGSVAGIILLAFVVNSIEFACSAAIPAVFTQVLTLSNLSTWAYYGYILLYDLFFMLDDLIIFGLAALAVNTAIGTRYAGYCKIIGGAILLLLGLILVFAPNILG